MKHAGLWAVAIVTGATLAVGCGLAAWRFDADITAASAKAAHGSVLIETRCGPIEYQEAGVGLALLVVHGGGGGYDQGLLLRAPWPRQAFA